MVRDIADRITWVAVADGEKSIILRNVDSDSRPDLRVMAAEEIDNPPDREQSAGRPGRMNDGRAGGVRKSSFEETDFHRLAKTQFARNFVARLNHAAKSNAFDRVIIIAPAATLGEMRAHYGHDLTQRVAAEIDKDLTNHPVEDIEKAVAKGLSQV